MLFRSGFSDFDDWFIERDIDIIRKKANEWKNCTTEESRKAHVSQHHVRWSEIYNLHYFNPVRYCVVDPCIVYSSELLNE